MLARRALTSHELQVRLEKKGGDSEEIASVIEDLERNGYLDDVEAAQDHIRHGIGNRVVGRFLIRSELLARGIESAIIDQLLNEEYPDEIESEAAQRFSDRKLRSYGELPLEKKKRRLAGSLERRGFSAGIIGNIIRNLDESNRDE